MLSEDSQSSKGLLALVYLFEELPSDSSVSHLLLFAARPGAT